MVWSSWWTDIPWFRPDTPVSEEQKQEFLKIFDATHNPFIYLVAGANGIFFIFVVSTIYAYFKNSIIVFIVPFILLAALAIVSFIVIWTLNKIISNKIRISIQETGSLFSGLFRKVNHD